MTCLMNISLNPLITEGKTRLSNDTLFAICKIFSTHFLQNDALWLFGSRVDLTKKGGDIDLYIETDIEDYSVAVAKEIAFLCDLKIAIGDQKIDVVLRLRSSDHDLTIYKIAKSEGIRIA